MSDSESASQSSSQSGVSPLHMVVLRHGPETCPAAHPELRDRCGVRFGQLPQEAQARGAAVVGAWADVAGHMFFILVAAMNAHLVSQLLIDLEVFHWNTVEIKPVTPM